MRQTTETTPSTTSDGNPANCMMVIGLPFCGSRNNWPSTSAIVSPPTLAFSNMTNALDARDEPVVDHPRRTVLKLAHALVEQADQVGKAIGNGRVDRIPDRLQVGLAHDRPIHRYAALIIARLGQRNDFRQDVD